MNKKTRIFILIISAAILAALVIFASKTDRNYTFSSRENKKPAQKEYKIGFITDIHGRKSTKKEGKIDKESEKVLLHFTEHMNSSFNPDFVIDGGDLIEGTDREGQKSIDDFNALTEYFKTLDLPFYHVNGNHEMRGFPKNEWLNLTGYEKSFYYFDYGNLRIFVLDGNENEKAMPELENYNKDFYYLSEEQFKWLEKFLSNSNDFQKIVFIHYPPFETPGTKMIDLLQSARLREIFSKNKVSAVFSGHTESLNFKEIDGVRYFVIPGTWRSKLKNIIWLESFAEINVGEEIEMSLYYKKERDEEYRTLTVPSEEYEKIEK